MRKVWGAVRGRAQVPHGGLPESEPCHDGGGSGSIRVKLHAPLRIAS